MEGELFITESMRFYSRKLSTMQRNRFRIQPQTSVDNISSGQITSVLLPEASVLDLHSFKAHFRVTVSGGSNSNTAADQKVYGKLPAGHGLLARCELFCNGVQIDGGAGEWNTVKQIQSIVETSAPMNCSRDKVMKNSFMRSDESNDDLDITLTGDDFSDFFKGSTRYFPSMMVGPLLLRITWAGPEVISARAVGNTGMAGPLGTGIDNNPLGYTISNLYFTVDSLCFDPMYDAMLRERLSSDGTLPITFPSWYSFSTNNAHGGGGTSTSSSSQFSLATQSMCNIYTVTRDATYNTPGQLATAMVSDVLSSGFETKYFTFQSFDSGADADTKGRLDGTLRYQYEINSVPYPTYRAPKSEAIFNTFYDSATLHDKVGNSVTSRQAFDTAKCVFPLTLTLPGEYVGVIAGMDTRGVSSHMSFNVSGATVTGNVNVFTAIKCQSTLLIGAGRQLSVRF